LELEVPFVDVAVSFSSEPNMHSTHGRLVAALWSIICARGLHL